MLIIATVPKTCRYLRKTYRSKIGGMHKKEDKTQKTVKVRKTANTTQNIRNILCYFSFNFKEIKTSNYTTRSPKVSMKQM